MWMINGSATFLTYAVIPAVLLIGIVALFRRRTWTILACVPLVAWMGLMFAGTRLETHAAACASGTNLRVMTANVMMDNSRLPTLANDVLAANPDVVVFEELRHNIADVSPQLAAAYPYRISTQVPWVTVASKWPLQDSREIAIPQNDRARDPLAATLIVNGQPISLLAVHAMPPLNAAANAIQVAQFQLLAAQVAHASAGPLLLVGDLNSTSTSPLLDRFLLATGLRISSFGPDVVTHVPRWHLGVRIDHVLERDMQVCGEQTVNLTGSDHRGLAVDLRLPIQPPLATQR